MPIPGDPAHYLTPANMAGIEPVRIGVALPLSHPAPETRAVAQALLDAAQLAVFESNNKRLLLIPHDTLGSAEGAASATSESLSDGAEVIVGPLFAQEVSAAAGVSRARNIPSVAFSTDRGVAGGGVYLLSFQPEEEVWRIISYAKSRGHTKFAGLFPQSPYGQLVESAFRRSVAAAGGTIIVTASYAQDSQGMLEPVQTVAAAEFDAILLADGGGALSQLARLLVYNGVDPARVKFLGTGLWDDPSILNEPAVAGGWFAAPDPQLRIAFANRFNQVYGYAPPRIASLAYDAITLVNSYSNGRPFKRFLLTTFSDPNGFAGLDGIFRFRPDGTIERGLAVVEVGQGKFNVLTRAPRSFQGASF